MSSFLLGCRYASYLLKHDAGVCIKSGNKALTFKRTQSDRRTFSNVPFPFFEILVLINQCDRYFLAKRPG